MATNRNTFILRFSSHQHALFVLAVVYSLFSEDHIDSKNEAHILQLRENFVAFLSSFIDRASITFLDRQVYFQNRKDSQDTFSTHLPVLLIEPALDDSDSTDRKHDAEHNFIYSILLDQYNRCQGCGPIDLDDDGAENDDMIPMKEIIPSITKDMEERRRPHGSEVVSSKTADSSTSAHTEHTSKAFEQFFGSSLTSHSDMDEDERKKSHKVLSMPVHGSMSGSKKLPLGSPPITPKLDDINAKWLANIFFGTNF